MANVEEQLTLAWYAIHTRALRESQVAAKVREIPDVQEVLLPVFHRIRAHDSKSADGIGPNELMFPNYVLIRSQMSETVVREITRVEGVSYLLGTSPEQPSRIPESEIALVQHLSKAERDPRLGDAPVKGRIARVVSGPLIGVEGLVLWRNRSEARLATSLRMAAGSFEVRVPLNALTLSADCKWSNGAIAVSSRRGGRRARRSDSMAA